MKNFQAKTARSFSLVSSNSVQYRSKVLPWAVALTSGFMLAMIEINVKKPLLMADRFLPYGGWLQILLLSAYGFIVSYNMQDPKKQPSWRLISWGFFSFVFFLQLVLGIFVNEKFLMTGKLHLPIPAMIIAGPIYRGHLSFMTILFLSTVILTGPAWCSQFCYFGAFDGLASASKKNRKGLKNILIYKNTVLLLVIIVALLLKIFRVGNLAATILGLVFGVIGMLIIIFLSRKKGKMIHCILYCPIGTLVHYLKFINPFRLRIDTNCNLCTACTSVCRYDALKKDNIKKHKPGLTCTLCGDCIQTCHSGSIHYKLFTLSPKTSRVIYLFLTITVHTVFLGLGRI